MRNMKPEIGNIGDIRGASGGERNLRGNASMSFGPIACAVTAQRRSEWHRREATPGHRYVVARS